MTHFLDDLKPLVDASIKQSLDAKDTQLNKRTLDYIFRGGKRIRPMLVFLGAIEAGGNPKDAVGVASAVEIMHNFTLIHDDIEDGSEFRRGKSSLHITDGIPLAINTGDAMFAKSFELIAKEGQELAVNFANTMWEIALGQDMDIRWVSDEAMPSEEEYVSMVSKKTAALLGFSLEAGYMKVSGKKNQKLKEYGINLGIAFQIIDDILGVVGKPEIIGKDADKDILEGKRSLPIVKAIEMHKDGRNLKEIILKKEKTNRDIKLAKEMIKASGSIDYCRKVARKYTAKCGYKFLDRRAKEALEGLKTFVINRMY